MAANIMAQRMKQETQEFTVGGAVKAVTLDLRGDTGKALIDGRSAEFRLVRTTPQGGRIEIEGRSYPFFIHREHDALTLWFNGRTFRLHKHSAVQVRPGSTHHAAGGDITALMPGKILRIDVQEGASVSAKQPLLLMESMKMETPLLSPVSGNVSKIFCRTGQVVDVGELLMTIKG